MERYDQMSTARLKWLVLDRLVPPDEEAFARQALIARDPELHGLVSRGVITEEQAIATLRARELRHRDPDDSIFWMRSPAAACGVLFLLLFAVLVLVA